MPKDRFRQAEFAAWVGIVGNIILALLKGIIGFISNSKALIADAAHSASDVAGSFAVLIGLKAAKKPPDEDHPYGHGKAEPIAAIIVSIILILVGLEIGISSVEAMIQGVESAPKGIALIAIMVSIIAKEAMFQYKIRLGKKLHSDALVANAWEHRSDVYSSIAALFGVGVAVMGNSLELDYLYYFDPIAGVAVSLLVIRMGYKLIMEAIHNTMDHVLHEEDSKEMYESVEQVHGVLRVDDLRAREHGHYVIVDVKVSVDPKISVHDGHEIGKLVKHNLIENFTRVSDVFVHINPFDPAFPYPSQGDGNDSHHQIIH